MNQTIINKFVDWQCVLRQRNFRKFSGKPSEGTIAVIYDKNLKKCDVELTLLL